MITTNLFTNRNTCEFIHKLPHGLKKIPISLQKLKKNGKNSLSGGLLVLLGVTQGSDILCQFIRRMSKLGMRRYGHHTIRYVSIQREMIWFFSIRYNTDNNCKNTNIHNVHIYTNIHNVQTLLFMNTT